MSKDKSLDNLGRLKKEDYRYFDCANTKKHNLVLKTLGKMHKRVQNTP